MARLCKAACGRLHRAALRPAFPEVAESSAAVVAISEYTIAHRLVLPSEPANAWLLWLWLALRSLLCWR
jgi:hypothetical protein